MHAVQLFSPNANPLMQWNPLSLQQRSSKLPTSTSKCTLSRPQLRMPGDRLILLILAMPMHCNVRKIPDDDYQVTYRTVEIIPAKFGHSSTRECWTERSNRSNGPSVWKQMPTHPVSWSNGSILIMMVSFQQHQQRWWKRHGLGDVNYDVDGKVLAFHHPPPWTTLSEGHIKCVV